MRGLFLIGLLTLVAIAPVSSASADDCAEPQNQATMTECAGKAYEKTDERLNALYQAIRKRLTDAKATSLFVEAQRAWIAFRDTECRFASSATSGGSIYPMILTGCLDDMTQKRIQDFETYLDCQEGDLACPVP